MESPDDDREQRAAALELSRAAMEEQSKAVLQAKQEWIFKALYWIGNELEKLCWSRIGKTPNTNEAEQKPTEWNGCQRKCTGKAVMEYALDRH